MERKNLKICNKSRLQSSEKNVRVCSSNKILLQKCKVFVFLSFTDIELPAGKKENEE
jgi:hypothetical protein